MRVRERERERERKRDQPPIGAAKLHDTPTAQAAASSSFECASFCKENKGSTTCASCSQHLQTIILNHKNDSRHRAG